jgi:hypothetical protein
MPNGFSGFLAGIGYMGQPGFDPLRGLDAHAVIVWVDNYCQARPLDHLLDAAEAFVTAHPHG